MPTNGSYVAVLWGLRVALPKVLKLHAWAVRNFGVEYW